MIRKAKIGLWVAGVVAGFVVFASSQVSAQVPTDSTRMITCPNGEGIRVVFDQTTGVIAAADYCGALNSVGECGSGWIEIELKTGYVCSDASKVDCRLIQNAEFGYFCGSIGTLGGNLFATCKKICPNSKCCPQTNCPCPR
jgi:hypothetical protein